MSLRRVLATLSTLLILVAAAGLYWSHVGGLLRKSVLDWGEARRAAGWQVEIGDVTVSGPPWRPRVRLDSPRIAPPGAAGWLAEADSATLDLDPAGQGGEIHAAGARLAVAGVAVTVEALSAALVLSASGPSVTLSALGIVPPAWPAVPLAPRIERLEIAGRVRGGVPGAADSAAISAWSAGGGTIEIDRLALDWAPLGLEGDGTLAFDADLQPLAAFALRLRGAAPLIDRLRASGRVEPGAALAAKTVMALLARPDSQGRSAVPVPLTLQDGWIWLGPARMARMPRIVWPG